MWTKVVVAAFGAAILVLSNTGNAYSHHSKGGHGNGAHRHSSARDSNTGAGPRQSRNPRGWSNGKKRGSDCNPGARGCRTPAQH
jgi:hypothetical protein